MGDDYVAYMEEFIHEHSDLLNIVLGGPNVVVAYHKDFDSVGMYVNNTGEPVNWIEFRGNSVGMKPCSLCRSG